MKLKLDLDSLNVQTFDVDAPAGADARGTVQAHAAPTMPVEYCFFSFFATCGIYC